MNKILSFMAVLIMSALSFTFLSCSSDEYDHDALNSFVGDEYVYEWTLQNTSSRYQYRVFFISDTTYTITSLKVENNQIKKGPHDRMYIRNRDGSLSFDGVAFQTGIKGQYITFYKGRFSDDMKTLSIRRLLEFNTGNKRTDWVDFKLAE